MRSRETGECRLSLAETSLLGLAGERRCLRLTTKRGNSLRIVICVQDHAVVDKCMRRCQCGLNTDTSSSAVRQCLCARLHTKVADVRYSLQLLPVHLELLGEWAGHHD